MGHKKAQKAPKQFCAFCAFLWLVSFPVLGQESRNLTPSQLAIQQQQQRLNSSDVEERRDAVMRLGAMRREAASRAVVPTLQDPAAIVRATAAKAILSLGSEAS